MVRPKKPDPATHKSTIRLNGSELELLRQLCALCDTALGIKPNAVLRALVRKEAVARGLVPELPSSTPEAVTTELDLNRRRLGARVRYLQELYDKVIGPHLQRQLSIPPTKHFLSKVYETTHGSDSTVIGLVADEDRYYQDVSPIELRKLHDLLTRFERQWAAFKQS